MKTKRLRLGAATAALALLAAACTGAASGGDGTESVRDPAPTAQFALFDGTTATLADYSGQPLVVNFWASWCPSCVAEMSTAFRPAQEELGHAVAFLGLNMQDERDKALPLIDSTGVLFDLGEDPDGELWLELGGIGMPFTVFISADGDVVERHNGPLTADQLVDMIEELLLG